MGRVRAIDVHRWVGFGKPLVLCFFEHGVKVRAGFCHAGEDVVGGAVEDAVERLNIVGDQALAEGLDDGDAAAYAGFKPESNLVLHGGFKEAVPALGEQGFVRGDDVFAGLQGGQDELVGRVNPAYDFDCDLDGGVRDHVHGGRW